MLGWVVQWSAPQSAGSCDDPNCRYAHNRAELKEIPGLALALPYRSCRPGKKSFFSSVEMLKFKTTEPSPLMDQLRETEVGHGCAGRGSRAKGDPERRALVRLLSWPTQLKLRPKQLQRAIVLDSWAVLRVAMHLCSLLHSVLAIPRQQSAASEEQRRNPTQTAPAAVLAGAAWLRALLLDVFVQLGVCSASLHLALASSQANN